MMGTPIDGPSYVYGDNMSVLHNTSNPECTLKKKSNSIAYHNTSNSESTLKKKSNSFVYHLVPESIALDEMRAGYINTDENCGDLMTKNLPRGERRENLLRGVMWAGWLVEIRPNKGSRIRKEGSNIRSDYVSIIKSLRGLNKPLGIRFSVLYKIITLQSD
jgi:hypothetical protein